MIRIRSLASSSAGNCYSVDDGQTKLLLECGIPVSKIRRACGFQLTSYAACLLSHGHRDHAGYAAQLQRHGVPVSGSPETLLAAGVPMVGRFWSPDGIGSWKVQRFQCRHDFPGTLGYVLSSGRETLLYMVDSPFCPVKVAGLTHLMIGCNWSEEQLRAAVEAGNTPAVAASRIARSHMSLERLLRMLDAYDLSQLKEVHLLHLSDRHSDADLFQQRVAEATGVPVHVAAREGPA